MLDCYFTFFLPHVFFVSVGPPDGPLVHPGVVVIEDDFVSFEASFWSPLPPPRVIGASYIGQIQLVRV